MTWSEFTFSEHIFFLAFLGQIFWISIYYPEKLLTRVNYVLDRYPPSEYPRLYPKSVAYYRIAMWLFKWTTRSIAALGLLIFIALLFVVDHSTFADDGYISEFWPMVYAAIQFLPILVLELAEAGQFKLMRHNHSASVRKADLRRRRLFDFLSPKKLTLVVFLFLTAIFFDLHVHDYVIDLGHDSMQRALVLTATNLFFVLVGILILFGKKKDPFQAPQDRARQINAELGPLCWTSMALSLFFIIAAADDVYAMDQYDALIMSLYFQVLIVFSIGTMLRNYKVEDINFEVYRATPDTP